MWRILIVGRERKYRELLRELFERAHDDVIEAGEGDSRRLGAGRTTSGRPAAQTVDGVGYRLDASRS